MGIKILTLALHAESGRPIYVKALGCNAYVRCVEKGPHPFATPYALEFIGQYENGLYPVRYDATHQGHVVVRDKIIEDVVDVD